MNEIDQLEHLGMAVRKSGITPRETVLPEDREVILNGMRFHYLDWGEAGRTPLVFLHGGGLTAHTWDVVCLALRDQFHCLALDQRGHGDSEWSPSMDYGIEAHVGDIEAFVDHLNLEKFVLVGMSMGGLNSIAYAARHSNRLEGLVIVDVGPELRMDGARKITDFTNMEAELDSVEEFVERAMSFNPRRDPVLLRRSLLNNLRRMPNGRWTWKYDRRHRTRWDLNLLKEEHAKLWEVVPNIQCPSLVVRAAQSDVFHDEDAERLAKRLPDGRWVRIENSGHTVQGDNPRDLVIAMRSFFEEVGLVPRH